MSVSPQRRLEIMDSLRRGTVPRSSLDAFAVGLERFEGSLDEELKKLERGVAYSRRCVANTGAARRFSPAGWPTAPASWALRPRRFRSPRRRRRCTGSRPFTAG